MPAELGRPLGDLAQVTVGHVGPMASEYVPRGIPFLRSQNVKPFHIDLDDVCFISESFHERLKKSALEPGDVVVVRTGAPGTAAIIPESLPIANCSDLVIIHPGEELDSRYLSYYINGAAKGFVSSRLVGAVQQHFNVGEAKKLLLPQVSLEMQRAIASILGSLDDKIDANRRAARASSEFITAAFNATMERTTAEEAPLFTVVDFVFGEPFRSEFFSQTEEGRPLIRIRDLKTFRPQFWTIESRERETVVQPGDVVIGMDAEFRPTYWCGRAGLLNQRVCLARPKCGGRAFVRELLQAPLAHVESFKTGTTVSHLNKSDLEVITVLVPDAKSIERFGAVAEPLREIVVALHRENDSLLALRDTLLPRLLNGEILIRDADHIEESV